MRRREAFTLIEVLIAIAIVGMIVPALYSVIDLLNDMNAQVRSHLEETTYEEAVSRTLYADIAGSDGNISIRKDIYDRLCIERTVHSLYDTAFPRVCWVVDKPDHRLIRVEGKAFSLPLERETPVYSDVMLEETTLFEVKWHDAIFYAYIRSKNHPIRMFAVSGIEIPKRKKKRTGSKR